MVWLLFLSSCLWQSTVNGTASHLLRNWQISINRRADYFTPLGRHHDPFVDFQSFTLLEKARTHQRHCMFHWTKIVTSFKDMLSGGFSKSLFEVCKLMAKATFLPSAERPKASSSGQMSHHPSSPDDHKAVSSGVFCCICDFFFEACKLDVVRLGSVVPRLWMVSAVGPPDLQLRFVQFRLPTVNGSPKILNGKFLL